MINISKYTGKDNPPWRPVQPASIGAATPGPGRAAAGGRPPGGRTGRLGDGRIPAALALLAAIGAGLLSWLAAIPRRLGDRLFAMNDTEAYWRSWQITRTHGGLGRIYRDPQFDTLAECPKCRGSGRTADLACPPCLGTGRITLGEVS